MGSGSIVTISANGGISVSGGGYLTPAAYKDVVAQLIKAGGENAVRAKVDSLRDADQEITDTVLGSVRQNGEDRVRALIKDIEENYPRLSDVPVTETNPEGEQLFWTISHIGFATDSSGNILRDEYNQPKIEIKLKNDVINESVLVTPAGFTSDGRVTSFIDSASPSATSGDKTKYKITQSKTNPSHIQRIDESGFSEVSFDNGTNWQTGSLPVGTEAVEVSTSMWTDNATGQQYIINSATGVKLSEPLGIDPDWQYRQDSLDISQGNLDVSKGRLAEDQRQFNLEFDEDRSQWTREFGEEQRQFDTGENRLERTLAANNYFNSLNELGRNYRTLIQTAPQMANAATNQGELIRNILSQGGDVLARTFFTRGGQSPLPEITQADLLNNLSREMTNIQQYESDAIKAENDRRTRADSRRADEEFRQAEEQRRADARAQFGQFINEMQPTVTESSSYDAEGYKSANKAYTDAQANLANAINYDYSSIIKGYDRDGNPIYLDANQAARAKADSIAAAQDAADKAVAADQADFTTFTQTSTMPDKPSFADWMATSEFATPLDRATFKPSFAPSQQLTVPEVPVPRLTSQAELIASDIATRPPAVDAMFAGTMPNALQFGDLPLPTLQQLNTLTPTERQMFNTSLLTQFNTPLEDVALQSQRQFGAPSMDRNRDLAKFRGYAR
jgi:hypothetical protein